MDNRTAIRDASRAVSSEVMICGIVQKIVQEEDGDRTILTLNDGSTIETIRALVPGGLSTHPMSVGCTVQLQGSLHKTTTGEQPTLTAKSCAVLGAADPATFPLVRSDGQTDKFLNQNPHMRIRTPRYALFARFRSATLSALSQVFDSHPGGPIYQVHLPLLTGMDCEGGAEVFAAPTQRSKRERAAMTDAYFGTRKFLNVSAVFHAEAFVQGLDRVWTLMPCWRPETQDSSRHLAEFWMLEVSLNYIDSLEPLYQLMEDVIHGVVSHLMQSDAGRELLAQSCSEELNHRWSKLLTSEWPRITFADAVKLLEPLRNEKADSSARKDSDITGEEEKYLCAYFDSPVFLTHFTSSIRLFQAAQSVASIDEISPGPDFDPAQTTEAFDLLLPGIGEICSGGLREHRLDVLVDTMRKKYLFNGQVKGPIPDSNASVNAQPYPYLHPGEEMGSLEWFADLRRWGSSPHGGFGIGFERLLQYLTGEDTVKDMISFPRYRGVCGC